MVKTCEFYIADMLPPYTSIENKKKQGKAFPAPANKEAAKPKRGPKFTPAKKK
jgi:hypothetical protein